MAVICMSVGGKYKLIAFKFEKNPVRNGGVFLLSSTVLALFLPCYRGGQFAAREQEGPAFRNIEWFLYLICCALAPPVCCADIPPL